MAYAYTSYAQPSKYGDGTGRNSYIVFNHGGFTRDTSPLRPPVLNSVGVGSAMPASPTKKLGRRWLDGTGRDTYASNVSEGSTLRYEDWLRNYQPPATAVSCAKYSQPPSPREQQLARAQRESTLRLSRCKSASPDRRSARRSLYTHKAEENVKDSRGELHPKGSLVRCRFGSPVRQAPGHPAKESFMTGTYNTRKELWI